MPQPTEPRTLTQILDYLVPSARESINRPRDEQVKMMLSDQKLIKWHNIPGSYGTFYVPGPAYKNWREVKRAFKPVYAAWLLGDKA